MIEQTDRIVSRLMSYGDDCPNPPSWSSGHFGAIEIEGKVDREDWTLYPTVCDRCGQSFKPSGHASGLLKYWRRADGQGEPFLIRDALPGAMWFADWMPEAYRGPDGHALTVVCPDGHQWLIDSRASNCTMLDDREHQCWVRHGTPPNVTVDKNGNTCQAGAGSIGTPGYHGFLRNGIFT